MVSEAKGGREGNDNSEPSKANQHKRERGGSRTEVGLPRTSDEAHTREAEARHPGMTATGAGIRRREEDGVTWARRNVGKKLDKRENVNLEREWRRSRTGVRLGVEAKW